LTTTTKRGVKYLEQIEISAKTKEEAIKSAAIRLGASLDELDIEIIEEGSKGLFGIGGKDAKIIARRKEKDAAARTEEFLVELLAKMNLSCTPETELGENTVSVKITGKNVSGVIGRHGETLDAVQYITNLAVNKGKSKDDYYKVIIDSENYRAKREETLIRLANNMAAKAVKYNKNLAFEPMTPYERRIIHSALQNNEKVTTKSIGEEPHRKIVIVPNK